MSLEEDRGFFQENTVNLPGVWGIDRRRWGVFGIVRACDSDFDCEFPISY